MTRVDVIPLFCQVEAALVTPSRWPGQQTAPGTVAEGHTAAAGGGGCAGDIHAGGCRCTGLRGGIWTSFAGPLPVMRESYRNLQAQAGVHAACDDTDEAKVLARCASR